MLMSLNVNGRLVLLAAVLANGTQIVDVWKAQNAMTWIVSIPLYIQTL